MGVKPKAKVKSKAVPSKRAQEALKKELVHGEGVGRLKVLESAHCTGVLASRLTSRDVRLEQVSLSIFGKELIRDSTIQINFGRRYGLIGANGSGKTTLLAALAARELPIPDHIDIWHVHQEADPTDTSALEAVVDTAAKEVERLEALILQLSEEDPEANADILEGLGDKLDHFDPDQFEPQAGALLHGLGFTETMMHKATKDMSGGWRMRVALAQALFQKPTLLILDEPTNHLDLGACVWLEEYLAQYPSTIILTSHSEDFMNTVCTEIMQLTQDEQLVYWGGNYAQYIATRAEVEVNQMKAYEKEQTDIAHLLEFIRSCGTYSNMRRQADSKQKIIDKMKEKGLTAKPMPDPTFMFQFPESESLPPPVLAFDEMSFSYSGKKVDYLYKDVNFGIDLDSRIALVGPNGAGKSTLLKLMRGELDACEGSVKRHSHLRIASYNQHSAEILPMDKSPLQFMQEKFDAEAEQKGESRKSEQEWRSKLGKYGVVGELQKRVMGTFSDGQKARVVFSLMSMANPHLLLLDEPTNHLDMACIDALADAINKFSGGTVLVSHDFRLIDKVAKEIWVCDKGVSPWKGDIQSYKKHLSKEIKKSAKARMSSCAGAAAGGKTKPATPPPEEESEEEQVPEPVPAVVEVEEEKAKPKSKKKEIAPKGVFNRVTNMFEFPKEPEAAKEEEAPAKEEEAPAKEEEADAAKDEPWTDDEQRRLEEALVEHAAVTDVKAKWKAVALAVGGTRGAKACAARFKECRELAKGGPKKEEVEAKEEAVQDKVEEETKEVPVEMPAEEKEDEKEEEPVQPPPKDDKEVVAAPAKDKSEKKELPPWLQKRARPVRKKAGEE